MTLEFHGGFTVKYGIQTEDGAYVGSAINGFERQYIWMIR